MSKLLASATMLKMSSSSMHTRKIEIIGMGLTSTDGVAHIIKVISQQRIVQHLELGHNPQLGHNPLGDDGCQALFAWLCSSAGMKHSIQGISLNCCNIGDRGLLAIAQYIKIRAGLRTLSLQGNCFSGEASVVASFAEALRTSHVESLALSNSQPSIITALIQVLDAPYLRDLQCSMCSLQPSHAASVISYIVSPRCRLDTFSANANSFGLRAVRDLVAGIERANFSLTSVALHMTSSTEDSPEDISAIQMEVFGLLRKHLTRNMLLKRTTETGAFDLLRYSRLLLLKSNKSPGFSSPLESLPAFGSLPIEIKLYILSLLAPTLSPRQRIHIYTYATDHATLPPLLPSLGRACLPDPTNLHFASASGCTGGNCMGISNTVLCNRSEERRKWMALVKCDRYEPDPIVSDAEEVPSR